MENAAGSVVPTDSPDVPAQWPRRVVRLVAGVIMLAAVIRLASLLTAPAPPPDLTPARLATSQWLQATSPLPTDGDGSINSSALDPRLVQLGVERIDVQRFDPNALVLILAGSDGQPGVAGVDDNGDTLVDNRIELGATRSDDVCVVVKADDRPPADVPALLLQRGAFLPLDDSTKPQQRGRRRAIVIGQTGQDHWSFVVPIES